MVISEGWIVMRFWEHEINDLEQLIEE